MPAVYTVNYTVLDGKGEEASTEINFLASIGLPNASIGAKLYAALIDDLVTGAIIKASITVPLDISAWGLNATPAIGADVEEGARFNFRTAGGFPTALRIPTFSEEFIVSGSKLVDLTDGDPPDLFRDAMIAGLSLTGDGGTGSAVPVDKRGEDITVLKVAKEQFVRSRK